MATDFLNDVRREIEGRTEDFYGELTLKAFYQGNAKAEQNLMEQTTQPFWQSLRLSVEVKMRLTQDTGSKIRNRYEKLCSRILSIRMMCWRASRRWTGR